MSRALLCVFGVLFASSSLAQKKLTGTLECAVPFFLQETKVGDRDAHSMLLTQRKCRWAERLEVETIAGGEVTLSLFTDVRQDQISDRGYAVAAMSNGDKIYFHYVSLEPGDSAPPAKIKGAMAFSGGSGAFEAISGAGTFSVERNSDGTMRVRLHCSYSLPSRSMK